MSRQKVLLVGWAAADWKLLHPLLDSGVMPNLAGLLARGVLGTLAAPIPLVDSLLWTSLATGARASEHGILGRETAGASLSLRERNRPAFWDFLKARNLATHLVNWPLTEPAEQSGGVTVADTFFELSRDRRHADASQLVEPADSAGALSSLRIEPGEVDDGTLRLFVPDLDHVCREEDDRLRRLKHAVAQAVSVQAVTSWLMENRDWDVVAVRFNVLADLASWALPLSPPKLDCVGEVEFKLYRQVMDAACRMLDLLLGPLLKLADFDTTVLLVSDHGLLMGDARPALGPEDLAKAGSWQRRDGVLVISGPSCRQDAVIVGAKLLDIAPTLLAAFDIAPSPEMPGRVLTEAFEAPWTRPLERVSLSWPSQAKPESSSAGLDDTQIERMWNLARSRMDGRHFSAALETVEKLHRARPDHLHFLHGRFEGQLALRKIAEARETLEHLLDRIWGTPQASLLQARLEYAARRFDVSLRHLESIATDGKLVPGVNLQIGFNLIKLNQSARAREYYGRELKIQPESAEAHAGLAYCCLRAGEFDPAIDHALTSISLNYELHYAHFLLGLAQARKGQTDRALISFQLVATLLPDFAPVHRCLAILYGHDPARKDLARQHRDLAHQARSRGWGF